MKVRAEQGDRIAQNSLGFRYQHGNGLEKDPVEARRWYLKAVEQGHGTAPANLCSSYAGTLNVMGDDNTDPGAPIGHLNGSEADIEDAIRWCSVGAKKGNGPSRCHLGAMYAKGSADMKPDYQEACSGCP